MNFYPGDYREDYIERENRVEFDDADYREDYIKRENCFDFDEKLNDIIYFFNKMNILWNM